MTPKTHETQLRKVKVEEDRVFILGFFWEGGGVTCRY
jgi:hypothetical protein